MDPITAFEIAKTLFAGISAAAAAVQVWYKHRDSKRAAATFDATYNQALDSAESNAAAQELAEIIPAEVIQDLEARADKCWTSYRNVLGGEYLPDEVEHATDAVQACVCRELRRIKKLNGSIPPKWEGQWQQYNCAAKNEPLGAKAAHA